ncbi:MAG: coproporphyrinogen III oxidase [Candidatus Hydrogenedentota bacterium]
MTGLYIHIPYCRTICPYCDFVKRPTKGNVPESFINALCDEMARYEGDTDVESVFFGGGTPSLVAPASLERIFDTMRRKFSLTGEAEITLEANPDDVTQDLIVAWRDLGVNRISMGVQSFDEEALRYLGRRHDADGARRACALVADHFESWNLDLMFGAHPVSAYPATLAECRAIAPPHVSSYGLTYEAGTPFGKRADEAIDDDTYLDLYTQTVEGLKPLARYEVSNFARPGFECRHNLRYWHNETYAGFGPGAYSFLNGVRARNHVKLEAYLADPGSKCEALELSAREIRLETVIQYLRLAEGLPKQAYTERFGRDVYDDFGAALAQLAARELVKDTGSVLQPTERGFELNNEIGLALVDCAPVGRE